MVEKLKPKMIVHAKIPQKTALSPPKNKCGFSSVNIVTKSRLTPKAKGTSPNIAADAVNNTGVRRTPPASIIASLRP